MGEAADDLIESSMMLGDDDECNQEYDSSEDYWMDDDD